MSLCGFFNEIFILYCCDLHKNTYNEISRRSLRESKKYIEMENTEDDELDKNDDFILLRDLNASSGGDSYRFSNKSKIINSL